jgi:hypothetical protein
VSSLPQERLSRKEDFTSCDNIFRGRRCDTEIHGRKCGSDQRKNRIRVQSGSLNHRTSGGFGTVLVQKKNTYGSHVMEANRPITFVSRTSSRGWRIFLDQLLRFQLGPEFRRNPGLHRRIVREICCSLLAPTTKAAATSGDAENCSAAVHRSTP